MSGIYIEILFIVLLILLNGVFAMSEMALVSSRKARLQQRANEGDDNARVALELANAPNDMLSTVQVGITMIGILAAVIGVWAILKQANANTPYLVEIVERSTRSTERIAQIAERIDARLRRQFPDIGDELGD